MSNIKSKPLRVEEQRWNSCPIYSSYNK